jgi:hypothetical protein
MGLLHELVPETVHWMGCPHRPLGSHCINIDTSKVMCEFHSNPCLNLIAVNFSRSFKVEKNEA